jgi:hypothetical protein
VSNKVSDITRLLQRVDPIVAALTDLDEVKSAKRYNQVSEAIVLIRDMQCELAEVFRVTEPAPLAGRGEPMTSFANDSFRLDLDEQTGEVRLTQSGDNTDAGVVVIPEHFIEPLRDGLLKARQKLDNAADALMYRKAELRNTTFS